MIEYSALADTFHRFKKLFSFKQQLKMVVGIKLPKSDWKLGRIIIVNVLK